MWGLVKSEFLKIISKKRFLVVIIFSFITIVLSNYISYKNTTSEKLPLYSEVKSINLQFEIAKERKEKAEANYVKTKSDKDELLLLYLNNELYILEQERILLSSLNKENSDWRSVLEEDINLIRRKKYFAEKAGDKAIVEDINKELKYKKYFIDNNIKYTNPPNPSAFYNFPSVLYYIRRFFMLIIVALLMSDIVLRENKGATIKAILVKPVFKEKNLLCKLIASILASNGIIIALQGLGFLLFGILFTYGNPNTPIMLRNKCSELLQDKIGISIVIESGYILPAWMVIIQCILLQILWITVCNILCFALSIIFKFSIISDLKSMKSTFKS